MVSNTKYKMLCLIVSVLFLIIGQKCSSQQLRGPPRVETNPMYLDSYVPATMQIIAHITELMKYELKPTPPTPSTTTTVPPTRPHRPGVYGPSVPPGPDAYFSRGLTYAEYVDRLIHPKDYNYFDRYKFPIEREVRYYDDDIPQNLESYFGKSTSDLIKLTSRIEDTSAEIKDVDNQVQEFSQRYDDSDFRFFLARAQRQPPTRAYVTLLSLYDSLNKEAKKLGFNKYNGYSTAVLNKLIDTSSGTSADQLKLVLSKVIERNEINNPQITKRINELLKDLSDTNSYLNTALRYIPPLKFSA